MSGYIKYFDDGGENMSFKIEDESIYSRYNKIWNKLKKTLNIRKDTKHSRPIYKTFNCVINNFFRQ